MRRILVLVAGGLLVLAGAGLAAAQEYPIQTGSLTVSNNVIQPGGTTNYSGNGFVPGSTTQLTLESAPVSLGSTTANGAGAISGTVTIPTNTSPGTHTLKATGAAPGGGTLVLSVSVSITSGPIAPVDGANPAGAVPTDAIAFTGSDSVGLGVLAVVLIVGGLVLVAVARRIGIRTT